ncbi:hypothetical protein OAO87_03640 [bacterium]|nr:hypothetical protein [bacterium]
MFVHSCDRIASRSTITTIKWSAGSASGKRRTRRSERREAEERWRANRERWAADATRHKAQLADKLEADGVACPLGHEMTKLSSWLGLIVCERCKERDLVQTCSGATTSTLCTTAGRASVMAGGPCSIQSVR